MSVSTANMCMDFFNQNLKEMKHTINSKKRFHSTDNVIVHVTMKQPDPYTVWDHLHGCKDSREEIVNVFAVIADMFLFVNKWIKKMFVWIRISLVSILFQKYTC